MGFLSALRKLFGKTEAEEAPPVRKDQIWENRKTKRLVKIYGVTASHVAFKALLSEGGYGNQGAHYLEHNQFTRQFTFTKKTRPTTG